MTEKEKTGFEKFVFPIILVIITVLVTIFVRNYFFSKSPELSYYITQSLPIDTGIKKYYSTTFNVLNTGNIPLKDVILNATFDDTIATINIEPPLSKNGNVISTALPEQDSLTLTIAFELAKEEQTAITVVSAGSLEPRSFMLKSSEVLAKKLEIRTRETPWPWVTTLLVLFILTLVISLLHYKAKMLRVSAELQHYQRVHKRQYIKGKGEEHYIKGE